MLYQGFAERKPSLSSFEVAKETLAGVSVYIPEAKRQKTEVERQAEKEKRAEREALVASVDPAAEWAIGERQPWADKQVKPAKPTEEQLAWLKEEGFIKEEEDEEKVWCHWVICFCKLCTAETFNKGDFKKHV